MRECACLAYRVAWGILSATCVGEGGTTKDWLERLALGPQSSPAYSHDRKESV
jgi:hypothetical protein